MAHARPDPGPDRVKSFVPVAGPGSLTLIPLASAELTTTGLAAAASRVKPCWRRRRSGGPWSGGVLDRYLPEELAQDLVELGELLPGALMPVR